MYKSLVRPLLFNFDSESIHHKVIGASALVQGPLFRALSSFSEVKNACLEVKFAGLHCENPIGLAAGFDKDCRALPALAALGFGHIEIGSVTAIPQAGNPRPRIFRLVSDSALINRMGFPSAGAEVVANRFRKIRGQYPKLPPVGINLGKSKVVAIENALKDYVSSFKQLAQFADYVTLNVSSPNTPELRKLQEKSRLKELFQGVAELNTRKLPLLVKLAPDLSLEELDQIIEICMECNVSGVIATNTTFAREGLKSSIEEVGGLSGCPLHQRSLKIVSHLYHNSSAKLPIIGSGGIANASDVIAMLLAGASMVQVYTALIYQGPFLVKKLNKELIRFCQEKGIANISELTGQKAL